jgi:hypothetical protein
MHKIVLPIIVVAIFLFGYFIVRDTLSKIYSDLGHGQTSTTNTIDQKSGCDAVCQKEIADQVAKATASLSAAPKIVKASPLPISTTKPQDSYIQISGSGSTQNTDWTDVTGTDFSFDVTRDFAKGAKFAWEGFLRVADANGEAFARIYDVTHGIGVDGSQISVIDHGDFTRANSINMNFWSGRNTYRVQIKSLNTFNVDYMGGKIRVSYQ